MILNEGDISKVVTAAVGAGPIPDFLHEFHEDGGLIYGMGPVISEYFTAYELYDAVSLEWVKQAPGKLQMFTSSQHAYALFRKYVEENKQNNGNDITARSNRFIQFSERDTMKIKIEGRDLPADQKQLSMKISDRSTNLRRQFFDRFSQSSYAIDRTAYESVKKGIDKDWLRAADDIDEAGYSSGNLTNMRQFMVRRACKFLMYDEIKIRSGRIFYALDNLDLSCVAQNAHIKLKARAPKVPVCTSELREIFRMWAFLRNHLTFYLRLEHSEPPWKLSDKDQWSAYAVERAKKVIVEDAEKTQKIDRLSELHAKREYDRVIDEYHRIPAHRLKKASLPFELRDDQEMDQG